MKTEEHKKKKTEDLKILSDVAKENFSEEIFHRVYAVDVVFTDTIFTKCVFENCYFRNCKFIRCDFTGSAFKSCNLRGAQFEGCKFRYSTWRETFLEENFLECCLPSEENLSRDLVRELRVNFSQIGNYSSASRASLMEAKLTGDYLRKSVFSREAYYRNKYQGRKRALKACELTRWKLLDLLWGNGESITRVLFSALFSVSSLASMNSYCNDVDFLSSFSASFLNFWGMESSFAMSEWIVVMLVITRFIFIGLFMAVLIKRLSIR